MWVSSQLGIFLPFGPLLPTTTRPCYRIMIPYPITLLSLLSPCFSRQSPCVHLRPHHSLYATDSVTLSPSCMSFVPSPLATSHRQKWVRNDGRQAARSVFGARKDLPPIIALIGAKNAERPHNASRTPQLQIGLQAAIVATHCQSSNNAFPFERPSRSYFSLCPLPCNNFCKSAQITVCLENIDANAI
jgi:hypothetical protein